MQNERKLFQKISRKTFNKNKANKGITLIALVISIIVMLILAGVSLNAVIGDNGIITQAQNATYMQGIAALEEYLQTEYVKYYDEADEYTNKIELLSSKMPNLCLKDGTKNYITYNGGDGPKQYYLVNKQSLPDDVKNQLRGGDTNEYSKYIYLIDVYGITEDLRVYYCENGTDTILGTASDIIVDPNTVLNKIKNNTALNEALTDILTERGVIIGEDGITVANVSALQEFTIDGTEYPSLTSLSGISEISSLKRLTLKNLNLTSIEGIEACTLLNYLQLENVQIENYTPLGSTFNLQYLYLYNPPSNEEINKLGAGLANSNLSKLEYFGIYGYKPELYSTGDTTGMRTGTNTTRSNIDDISGISQISQETKNAIKYMYLNNNKISNINALSGFNNLYLVYLMCNSNLTSLEGLENHTNLEYIYAQACNFSTITGLSGCTALQEVTVQSSSNLSSLSGLESATNLNLLYAYECNLTDISALNGKTAMIECSMYGNENLENVSILQTCTALDILYLESNENMRVDDVILIEPILLGCTSYTLPSKYLKYFSTVTMYNYTDAGLTDYSEEILALKDRTNVTYLRLYGNTELGKSKIGKQIKEGNLKYDELDKIVENLSLTDSENSIIQAYKSRSESQIKNMTDTEIANIENSENDIYLRYVLSTMTGLTRLSVGKISNLTSIDFVNKVTKLIQLDLRNTSNSLTDLSKLETNAMSLKTLAITNPSINMKAIQKTISRLTSESGTINNIITNKTASGGYSSGLLICGSGFLNSFKDCTNITNFIASAQNAGVTSQTIDLSTCTGITYFNASHSLCTYILPSSVTTVSLNYGDKADFTNCTKLSNVYISQQSKDIFDYNMSTLINSPLKTLSIGRTSGDFSAIGNLTAAYNTLTTLNFCNDNWGYNSSGRRVTGDCSSLSNFKALETLNIYYNHLSGILNGISNLTTLKTLNANTNDIGDISELSNLTNLTSLNLNGNNISNLNALSNLKNLQILGITDNSITNLRALEGLIVNGKTNLRELYLSNNSLENYTTENVDGNVISVDNISILKNLNSAGLTTLNISGNNFQDTSSLKNLTWSSYTE